MPWKAKSVMDEKLAFIADCLRGEEPMTVLCERYGISRETGHLWKRRYGAEGAKGLEERSRAPHRHGRATAAELVVRLVEARKRKPYWGPRKLLAVLKKDDPAAAWPAASTVADILRREGLSERRRRRRRPLTVDRPFAAVTAANDAWCVDFKGWFRTGDGSRCDPLTVTDAFSRYLLGLEIVAPVRAAVEAEMDRLFREHGLPRAIRSDNGPPFASTGAGGLTRLSARWAKMGIGLERIYPGKPYQNGRHERMHGTLKPEACERRRRRRPSSSAGSTPFARSSTTSVRTRHSARPRRPRLTAPRPAPFPSALRTPVTLPKNGYAGCAPAARSSGAAAWCLSRRR